MKNRMHNRILACLVLCAMLVMCALPSAQAAERTLYHSNQSEGYIANFVQQLFVVPDGILAIVGGSEEKIWLYPNGETEPKIYSTPAMPVYEYSGEYTEENPYQNEQIANWFEWNGEVYAIQYMYLSWSDGNSIGTEAKVRRLVLEGEESRLEDTEIPTLDWTYMVEDYGDWKGCRSFNQPFVSGDRLIGLGYGNEGQSLLECFDLTSGMMTEETLPNGSQSLSAGPEGSCLITVYDWSEDMGRLRVIRYDIATATEEDLLNVSTEEATPDALCYDEANNRLVFVRSGQLWVTQGLDFENAQAVADCPLSYDIHTSLLGNDEVLLWGSSAGVVRSLTPAQTEKVTLNVRDYAYVDAMNEAIYDMIGAHPEASVVISRTGSVSNILQAMMNRDDSVDIYSLPYQSGVFEALRNRGFLTDLSGNAALTAAVDRMYPFMQNALRQDGRLVAVPLSLYGSTLGIRTDLWEKLGGTEEELPKTWMEFFDWLETLPEKCKGQEISPFGSWIDRASVRSSLMSFLLEQYQVYLAGGETQYAFHTPLLQGLLERMDALDYDALGVPELQEDSEEGYVSQEYTEALIEMYTSSAFATWNNPDKPLMVSLEEGMEPVLPLTLNVAFVNPYSKNQELAADYLSRVITCLGSSFEYSVYPDMKEPKRYPDYEETLRDMQNWLDEARKQLESATDEETREMMEQSVKDYEESLASYEESAWMISPKSIEEYQERVPYLTPLAYDFVSALNNASAGESAEYYDLFNSYVTSQISADQLLTTIDRKVQMMRLEGN